MPRKVFVAGEILTASDVNVNLMDQAVQVFDNSAARSSAIPSPSEGMVTYLKDTNLVESYTGAAFEAVGSIQGVNGLPFRMAANTVVLNGVTTVTFPSGRFSQAPKVTAMPSFGGAAASSFYTNRTSTSSTSVNLYNVTNGGVLVTTNQDVDYIAVQMTSGSGGG